MEKKIPSNSEANTETDAAETKETGETRETVENQETEEKGKSAESQETGETDKSAESQETGETDKSAESQETGETDKSAENQETGDQKGTAEGQETGDQKGTAEGQETGDQKGTSENQKTGDQKGTAEVKMTSETVAVNPAPPSPQPTGGNWAVVTLILLLIAAAGAAVAVILLHRKNKSMKNPYQWSVDQNAATEVNQEPSSSFISCGMAQTIGKREQQQDSLYCSNWKDPGVLVTRGMLAAVADGIGGLKDGNLASQNAMQAVRSTFLDGSAGGSPSDRLLACAAAAQKSVLQLNETSSCGATLVSVLITGRSMHFLSIGDSRIYLYRAGVLLQLNREHILRRTNEEKDMLYGTGEELTRKRAGALTSYLGKSNLTQIDRSLEPMKLLPGDRIALMSDGVFNVLSEEEIIAHLRKNPEAAAIEMIQDVDAHDHPSQDNATVVVIGIE